MKKTNNLIDKFLEELRKVPIVQVACEKAGISRNSIYRWKRKDEKFSQKIEQALVEGEAFVNDISESQLFSMIKEGEWPAVNFWLRHRHPKFKDKVEITTKNSDEKLTPEQESMIRQALEFSSTNSNNLNNSDD